MNYLCDWTVPEGISGDANLLRFRPSHVRTAARTCPQRLALKVRPALRSSDPVPRGRKPPDTYALSPVERILDLRAFDGLGDKAALLSWRRTSAAKYHGAHMRWVEHAVSCYLQAEREIESGLRAEGMAVEPVSQDWARRREFTVDGTLIRHEETVTGRRFDGTGIRELRLLRYGSVEDRPVDEAEVGLAAGVVAGARRVLGRGAGDYRLGSYNPVERVRVVEVGLSDASHRVLFDGTAAEAHSAYVRDTEDRLWQVAGGSRRVPGDDCSACPLLGRCPEVPSVPGLLGVAEPGPYRKVWSVSTGRSYAQCPAPSHLDALRLPKRRESEETSATRRGRMVHDWIESQHRRTPVSACTAQDADDAVAAFEDLPAHEARLAVQMAGDHASVCPLAKPSDVLAVRPEDLRVAFDPIADVVVVAKADLLYRTAKGWTLRETKTVQRADEGGLLERSPQIALGVLLSAHGALPGGPGGCRVELERLTATGPVLREFAVHDPVIVARARQVVGSLVGEWLRDRTHKERPGRSCSACAYAHWCPSGERRRDG